VRAFFLLYVAVGVRCVSVCLCSPASSHPPELRGAAETLFHISHNIPRLRPENHM